MNTTRKRTRVVTWQSPAGSTICITPAQEQRLKDAGRWPRDDRGDEYCQVSVGLHDGVPDMTDEEIEALIG